MKNIKTLIVYLVLFLCSLWLTQAQSTNQNYVKTTIYKGAGATQPVHEVTYFDGLGRPIQKVANAQSNSGKDIVTHIEYDAFGRQLKDYLPYVNQSPSLNYNSSATTEVNTFYNTPTYENTLNPYNEKLLEDSPLDRVLKQAAVGNDWKMGSDHEIKFDYQTNTATEVKLFKAIATKNATTNLYDITLTDNGNYSANQLFKTITKDEYWISYAGNSHTIQEFKDKDGQIVLKRTFGVSMVNNSPVNGTHDTYYVYDQYGNLTYMLPPLANGTIDQNTLDGLCYQYKYDYRNRLAAKKLPGKQWEFIVYDKQDRPVATGPALSPWGNGTVGILITQYDAFGRVTQTGWRAMSISETTRNSWQNDINAGSDPFILTENDILTKNYYDNYTFPNAPTLPTSVESQYIVSKVKGLPTGSWVRILTAPTATSGEITYTFYDQKYRPVRIYTSNYLGGFTQVDTKLDFIGKTLYTITTHKRTNSDAVLTVRDNFTYTAQERLLLHTQQVNGGTEQLIAKNTYNELGQLISKKVGGTDITGTTSLQKVDYKYNIRGWLKGINDVTNLTQGTDPQDLFAFKINYNDYNSLGQYDTAPIALYNGNVSATYWRTSSDNIIRKYNYAYDNLNRLLQADYSKPQTTSSLNNYLEQITYDKNGNITSLVRNGDRDSDGATTVNTIDNLAYTYHPNNKNQLMKVFDSTNNSLGFKDDSTGLTDTIDDYLYDLNGNLTKDDNKGITSITYNHLNLPVQIVFGNNGTIDYLYDATGKKVSKKVKQGSTIVNNDYLAGGFQYKDNVLLFFGHAEGYVNVAVVEINCTTCNPARIIPTTTYNYVFNYTDHLGNIRLSYGVDPSTGVLKTIEENHYYPFGLKQTNYNSDLRMLVKSEDETSLRGAPAGVMPYFGYRFNGQEHQEELGLNTTAMDYRQYDMAIGRFNSIDVLSELFPEESTYNFGLNNPVVFSDPSGLCPECPKNPNQGQVYNSTGGAKYIFNNGQWERQDGQLAEVTVTATANKKTSNDQDGKKVSSGESRLFGLIQNANVNSHGQSPLEAYRENRGNAGYNTGEDKWDRIFRLMGNSHIEIMQDFGGGGYNMWGGYGRALQATKAVQATEGTFSVYEGVNSAGQVKYVGITSRNPFIRFAEHLSTMGEKALLKYRVIEGATNLTKEQAKVLEQTLINQYQLQKNGGQLINKINSIAPKRWGAYGIGQ